MGAFPTVVHPEYKIREDGSIMRALAWFGTRDARLIDAPIPDISAPDDLILKVTGTTICGSDLHLYNGEIVALQTSLDMRVGPNMRNVKIGQRVVASFRLQWYGHRNAAFFGHSHFAGGFAGGQAEYVRAPKGNVNLLSIPNEHNVMDTGVQEGDVVGIWGLGPIGQCVAQFAKMKGVKRIIGIDRVPERLAFVRDKTGIETLDSAQHTDVVKRLQEIAPGTLLHKVEKALMLETDVPEIVNEMVMSVKKGGRCGVIATYAGHCNHFNRGALMEKGVRLFGNGQAPVHKWWKEILYDLIIPRKFDPTL
ncbi:Zinc-type alcohol dehydrogenase-like protein [Sparassis crispa]|uniref:Zinc-type alcohol dehydrogenase-like protein n=1 Tax=Sparassis crispa TaxID=139825 RepID=A0A401G7U4_9APHY|nr:Zinc-type alcohol dehydrogenase-like protein [Sparassis crispa]GBE78218.1 Zinc-type alcohol dehydrogenase-like protein [Sparassis crispa]